MKRANVVIGAGYGDEGKGLITDYLCNREDADLVVRFNGGSQAGHTVVTPNGSRHVFGHFGSGTMLGVPTLLSHFFVVNPMLFSKELSRLTNVVHISNIMVHVDVDCHVTTPYDILINQMIEDKRGACRHGSCGVGFGETIERSHYMDLRVKDLEETNLRSKLDKIRKNWFPRRAQILDLDMERVVELINNDHIVDNYVQDVRRMLDTVMLTNERHVIRSANSIVFEGAQGLMLDQDYGTFPYVTRSNTGMKNAAALCMENDIELVTATYVTRCYTTRHGSGPLYDERSIDFYVDVVDETNKPHDYQGSLRFAPLNTDTLSDAITHDFRNCPLPIMTRLAVTCLDQIREDGLLNDARSGSKWFESSSEILQTIDNRVQLYLKPLSSYGPTRNDVR